MGHSLTLLSDEEQIELLRKSYAELMTIIHLDDWDELPCPICDEEIWYRSFERLGYYIIGPLGVDMIV